MFLYFVAFFCLSLSSGLADENLPNIVLIVTDDQDLTLGSLTALNKTRRLIADEGVTITNAFCTTPVCCPSRSSILTGLYQHSHHVVNNSISGNCNGKNWRETTEQKTFATDIHDRGYKTFYAGKYLNNYGFKNAGGTEHVPPGWDWWIGLVGNSVYYDYSLSVNGTKVNHGSSEQDYLTDVVKNYALDFLKQNYVKQEPFLMAVHTPSAHSPFTPAPKYKGYFKNVKAPRTPNFNKPGEDKHWLLRLPPATLPQDNIDSMDRVFRDRWETLLSVDDLVESIVVRLQELEILNSTYILFTSDHGYHVGQFGLPWDKRQPYEFDVRIPMLVRGPGVPKKKIVDHPILTIDIAPTLVEMAGGEFTSDGESFLSKLQTDNTSYNRSFLIEYKGESGVEKRKDSGCWNDTSLFLCMPEMSCRCQDAKNNTWSCVRTLNSRENKVFCQFEDNEQFVESYDLNTDPYQLVNLKDSSANFELETSLLGCFKNQDKKHFSECLLK